nr:hypothetical protein [Micromonospora sp. DSM 115978]
MTQQQVGFDPDVLVDLASKLREAASAASAVAVAVGQAERRAGELGAPPAGPAGFFDALDYLAFGAPTVRGLRTVALDAPSLAAEVERRTAHLAAADRAA